MEVWLLILEQLCPHCHSHEIPDLRLPEHRLDMSALWALSITCRSMHETSRPSLYHCFYSTPTQDRASKFLRTLIAHPQLGRHIRLLSLPEMSPYHQRNPLESATKVREEQAQVQRVEAQIWINLSVNRGIRVPHILTKAISPSKGSAEVVMVPKKSLDTLRDWLHILIIGLCPRVTHLELPFIPGPYYQGKTPPALRRLQVLSCKSVFDAADLPWFLSDAPAMGHLMANSLYCSFFGMMTAPPGLASPPVTTIRSLSAVMGIASLHRVFGICPQLEDLEIHLKLEHWEFGSSNWVDHDWPDCTKLRLKRLAWSNMELSATWSVDDIMDDDGLIIPPIRDLKSLEILEIDRSALYVAVKRGLRHLTTIEELGSQLPTILPPPFRILRTSFGMEPLHLGAMVSELHALALAKKTFLPNLYLVRIGENPPEEWDSLTLSELLEPMGVTEVMEAAGIELRFEFDPEYPQSTGIMPLRPGSTLEPYDIIEERFFDRKEYW